MNWDKVKIKNDNGKWVEAIAPVILSVSRSTDIPAFYADWFFSRLEKGYCVWTNPFSGTDSYVSFAKTKAIVFWSKNPAPLLPYLDRLKERGIHCYIHFTLNDYGKEELETGVPPLQERIEAFKQLSNKLGKERIIWRFDPLFLSDKISKEDLLAKIKKIGDTLQGYTEKLVFGFSSISTYKKVKANLELEGIKYLEFTPADKHELAKGIARLNKTWGYELASCSVAEDFSAYGIGRNRCIDDRLMIRLFSADKELMRFLGYPEKYAGRLFDEDHSNPNKDKGQRKICECISSKDIGQYNTCPHFCEYCYANKSKETAFNNWKNHLTKRHGDKIK